MTFLRRVLSAQAALWAVFGFVVGVAPGWLLQTVARQPALTDDAWLRALGVIAVVLALLMMLVSQRLEDVWWWAWAFVVLEAGTATVFMLHALFGLPEGASDVVLVVAGVRERRVRGARPGRPRARRAGEAVHLTLGASTSLAF